MACAYPAASRAQRGEAVRWMRLLGGTMGKKTVDNPFGKRPTPYSYEVH